MHPLAISRRKLCLPLKTGQVTQYGGYPDDGSLQKGQDKAYSVLTAGQYSGTTNITLNGKTDVHSNNCVVSLQTGLMWSRYLAASVGPSSNGQLPWTTNANGEGIFAYCAAANAANLAGYNDWRVPNIEELSRLSVREAPAAVPDATAFPSFLAVQVHSSTTLASDTASAVSNNFQGGQAGSNTKTTPRYCLLVRG